MRSIVRVIYCVTLPVVVVSCVIFPNSLKVASAVSLAVTFVCALALVKMRDNVLVLLVLWVASAVVTAVYMLVGVLHGAPDEAAGQVFLIYIVFPFSWLIVLAYLLQVSTLKVIVRGLVIAGVLASLSVLLFYYAFARGWEGVTRFFIEEPNVDTSTEGYVAAAMYVFGSLIFIVGGYVASFNLQGGNKARYLILPLFILVAVSSGRSALILSILVGLLINAIVLLRRMNRSIGAPFFKGVILLSFSCALTIGVIHHFDLELGKLLAPVIEKIVTAGGAGRRPQLLPLLDGIGDNFGLGSGHGMGVSYIASETYPWRYEMVWLASAFRVGLIGSIIYAAPFVLAMILGFRALLAKRLDEHEIFLLGGLVTAFIASNTNPYIEAFVFQWMYVLPVLYFMSRKFLKLPWTTEPSQREPAIPE